MLINGFFLIRTKRSSPERHVDTQIIEFGKPVTFSVDMISRKINSYTMLYLWRKNIKERLIYHLVIILILL